LEFDSWSIEISFKFASSSENESTFKVVSTGSTVVIGRTTKVDVWVIIVVVVDGANVVSVTVLVGTEVVLDGTEVVLDGTEVVLVGTEVVLAVVILSVVVSAVFRVVVASSDFFCE
jgi:hypothetical protein